MQKMLYTDEGRVVLRISLRSGFVFFMFHAHTFDNIGQKFINYFGRAVNLDAWNNNTFKIILDLGPIIGLRELHIQVVDDTNEIFLDSL